MKKLITPLLYTCMLVPLTAIGVATEMAAMRFGLLPDWPGYMDATRTMVVGVGVLAAGTPLLLLANLLMDFIEGTRASTALDHLRRSVFYYLMSAYVLLTWIREGFSGDVEDGYLLMWLSVSVLAIATSYAFRYRPQ